MKISLLGLLKKHALAEAGERQRQSNEKFKIIK